MPDIYAIYARMAYIRQLFEDEPPDAWGRYFRHSCKINGFGNPNISIRWPGL
jgi:hypothetical protein